MRPSPASSHAPDRQQGDRPGLGVSSERRPGGYYPVHASPSNARRAMAPLTWIASVSTPNFTTASGGMSAYCSAIASAFAHGEVSCPRRDGICDSIAKKARIDLTPVRCEESRRNANGMDHSCRSQFRRSHARLRRGYAEGGGHRTRASRSNWSRIIPSPMRPSSTTRHQASMASVVPTRVRTYEPPKNRKHY